MLHGIDVSAHQPANIPALVSADFAIIKATGGTGYINPHALKQRFAAPRRAGFYHFAGDGFPWTKPEAEAQHFLELWRALAQPGDVPVLDWEPPAPVHDTAWAYRWLDIVAGATGTTPLLYCNLSVATSFDWSRVQALGVKLWLAYYGNDAPIHGYRVPNLPLWAQFVATGWGHPPIWQYTQNGYLPGYGGNLDLNIAYEDLWDASTGRDLVPGVNVRVP
ncbi:GH25 family lysozyme [Arthrobacter sp. SX1312]|uniref:GH25 family lysozyme n=1 Tax=Arthrobacter sp. SX1312 TaxID=2058896 RepID=UPI000CE42025|nr:GH25 family lysozyme [Arthrobacter sp. SX1312]